MVGELERLNGCMNRKTEEVERLQQWHARLAAAAVDCLDRAREAEAEVERLREALRLVDEAHGPLTFDDPEAEALVAEALIRALDHGKS